MHNELSKFERDALLPRRYTSLPLVHSQPNMSLATQQVILQARADRDDLLRRISVGEDTPKVRELLAGSNKRIARFEKQFEDERAALAAKAATAAAASAKKDGPKKSKGDARPRPAERTERAPLPEDIELSCCNCSSPFTFSGKDQVFFTKNDWAQPTRCTDCREAKKSAKPSGVRLTCSDCKVEFLFTDAKARIFEEKGWANPKRCRDCKAKKSAAPVKGADKKEGDSV